MTFDIKSTMAEALRLTKAGRLSDATADIRQALTGNGPKPDRPRQHHPLGDTVKALGTLRKSATARKPAPRSAPVSLKTPGGAEFVTKTFSCHAGKRAYKLYIPACKPQGRRPLLVMLHGCTQNADDFAAGTRMNALAEEYGMLVAYPVQPKTANASACWNWFNPGDQQRGAGEPAILAGLTREIAEQHKIDPTRIYVAGLSAGGAMAMVMGAAHPELYAAIGVHSGLPYQSANDVMSALGVMRSGAANARPQQDIRTIVFHGDADSTVHPANGEKIADRPDLRKSVTHGQATAPNGRHYTRTVFHNGETGVARAEHWQIKGAGHAWAGGSAEGSYTDPKGPDASAEMLRFFLSEDPS